ncbi:MAG: DNA polymerase III subunit beta [Candidatus Saganbacteria bacterium]|nr:DNA polymerase III subunit beta [Candidatus Saganbacteria bacterium]
MEFMCEKDILMSGVSVVERIVSSKSTLPIIGNVLVEAKKNGIKVSANNLELGIEMFLEAKVAKEGSILIPAKTLAAMVSKLPKGNIDFKVSEKGMIKVSYSQSHFSIHGLPPDEFPTLPKIKEEKVVTIGCGIFLNMIKKTIFSVSTSEDKYVLNGVLLEVGRSGVSGDNSNVRLVATDGYRLAKIGEKIKDVPNVEVKIIIPSKALVELSKILAGAEEDEEINISIGKDQIAFSLQNTFLVSRLIQGQFPDYKQVIPRATATKLTIPTQLLLDSSERAAVIASSSANVVKFELKADKLHILATAPEVGSVDETIDVEVKGADKTQVAFNVRLITDVLKVIDQPNIMVEISGPLSPGVFRPVEGLDYIYIVMPIRTQETSA